MERVLIKRWTKEDVKALRQHAKARSSTRQAAKTLKRSLGAVSQKAMKLGIRFRSRRGRNLGKQT